ncbi:MAG TPA: 5-oxoprolinase subunit PxpA [Micromonosporaceae bacterium]
MDLNADLGESFGAWRLVDDLALLEIVTSANVACGFHAGDPPTMRRVCHAAAERGVAIGAQVSYRDLAGFGRRRIDYDFDDLRDDILYQIGALDAFARAAGTRVRYVKPHGALYHVTVSDATHAAAVVAAVNDYDPNLPVLGLPGSMLLRLAAGSGLRTVPEGFADRGYQPDGTLVPRRDAAALVTSADDVVARALRMALDGKITAVDGTTMTSPIASLCIHGDTPGAVALATRVRHALLDAGVPLAPFS